MHRPFAAAAIASMMASVVAIAPAASSPAPHADEKKSSISLTTSPIAGLHYHLRAALQSGGGEGLPPPLRDALERYREVDRRLGASAAAHAKDRLWRLIDAQVRQALRLKDLGELAARLPDRLALLKEAIPTLVNGMRESEPSFRQAIWDGQAGAVTTRLAWWDEQVVPHLPAIERFASGVLQADAAVPGVRIAILPVMPEPGGFTYQTPRGYAIALSAGKYTGSAFAEVVIHEYCHVLDASTTNTGLLASLRRGLETRGISPEATRHLAHVVVFMTAAEAVRRLVDPRHVPVARYHGVYARGLEKYRQATAPAFERYLAGGSADAFVAQVVESAGRLATDE